MIAVIQRLSLTLSESYGMVRNSLIESSDECGL